MAIEEGMPLSAADLESEWVDLTAAAGWTLGRSAGVRMKGGLITFRGLSSGTLASGANVVGIVPAGFRPGGEDYAYRMLSNSNSAAQPAFGFVNTAGQIIVYPSVSGAAVIGLGGLSGYSID